MSNAELPLFTVRSRGSLLVISVKDHLSKATAALAGKTVKLTRDESVIPIQAGSSDTVSCGWGWSEDPNVCRSRGPFPGIYIYKNNFGDAYVDIRCPWELSLSLSASPADNEESQTWAANLGRSDIEIAFPERSEDVFQIDAEFLKSDPQISVAACEPEEGQGSFYWYEIPWHVSLGPQVKIEFGGLDHWSSAVLTCQAAIWIKVPLRVGQSLVPEDEEPEFTILQ